MMSKTNIPNSSISLQESTSNVWQIDLSGVFKLLKIWTLKPTFANIIRSLAALDTGYISAGLMDEDWTHDFRAVITALLPTEPTSLT